MATNPNDPYEFILNPQKPARPPLIDLSGASMFKRLILVFSGLFLLIVITVFGMSFLNKSAKEHNEQIFGIIQTQSEIIRVAGAAQQKIYSKDLLNQTINTKLSINSSKSELSSALAESGYKINTKKLLASQNPDNDALLEQGEQNGTFDQTYQKLLESQLTEYQAQLQAAYETATPSEQAAIQSSFEQVNLLLGKTN